MPDAILCLGVISAKVVEALAIVRSTKSTDEKVQKIQIQASGGLSDEEIKNMVKEAESNKEADKKKRETVDARNQADTIIHTGNFYSKNNLINY